MDLGRPLQDIVVTDSVVPADSAQPPQAFLVKSVHSELTSATSLALSTYSNRDSNFGHPKPQLFRRSKRTKHLYENREFFFIDKIVSNVANYRLNSCNVRTLYVYSIRVVASQPNP